ncbi:MAG: carbohydrate kinase family protein [Ignavibacteria bacterium]|nr:carbohydrate kinase family protein [Ignavibacteria bacterium]
MQKYVCAIGGINLDIKGIADSDGKADSNLGKIHFTPGGVARNISENLAKLNVPVYLLGCIGEDTNGKFIDDKTKLAGVNTEHVFKSPDIKTSVYLSVSNNKGELITAVNDMTDSIKFITVDYLESKFEIIKNSKVIFADTNLESKSLQYIVKIANENNIPLYIDTVSIEKSNKVKDLTGTINYLSPNLNEFNNLFGEFNIDRINFKIENPEYQKYNSIILKRGDKGIVFINLKNRKIKIFNAIHMEAVEPNGAGDAFNAGFIYGLMNSYEEYDCIHLGICAAYYTLKSVHSVSEKLTEENLVQLFNRKTSNEF